MFGHKKGSFTGAHEDKVGLFEQAVGGTLFLDEVGDLPLEMQVKLLRAIQEKKIRPVGSSTEIPINVRFISATAQNLSEMVNNQTFREDLYYRINVIECRVPALSDHKEDIPSLVSHILKQQERRPPLSLNSAAHQALLNYAFPGNIRELENILERAATLAEGPSITVSDLQLPTPHDDTTISLDDKIDALEKQAIFDAIVQANGNKKKAAELLGIPYRSLRYRLSKIQDEDTNQ